jgi:hypothetical protein
LRPHPVYGTILIILSRSNFNKIPGVKLKSFPLLAINSRTPISDIEYKIPKCSDPYASNFPRNFSSAGVNGESCADDAAASVSNDVFLASPDGGAC